MPNELKPCRDRLIELVEKMPWKIVQDYNGCRMNNEEIADYLLANGVVALDTGVISHKNRPLITHFAGMPINDVLDLVRAKQESRLIVPPCKVGDTVYDISEFYDGTICPEMYEYKVNHIDLLNDGKFEIEFIPYPDEAWGKTLFLTKEEAEAKLKEREGNG